MDHTTLVKAMPGLNSDRAAQLIDNCNRAMLLGEITTQKRAAMFLAQVGYESGSLTFTEEISPEPDAQYRPYIGRTYMQITWKENYAAFGRWCVSKNLLTDPDHFVDNPTELAADKWAWHGAVWYWTVARSTLNKVSDQGDVREATRLINGEALNGVRERQDRYDLCRSLGAAILPDEEGDEFDMADLKDLDAIVRKYTDALHRDLQVILHGGVPDPKTGKVKVTHPRNLDSIFAELDAIKGKLH